MRSFGSELLSVALALAIPVGIIAAFPFGAFSFRAAAGDSRPARTAFVRLSPEAEGQALRAVRVSWKEKVGGARRMQADIFCPELPTEERLSVLTVRDRSRPPMPPTVPCERTAFLPSLKAPPPIQIKPGKMPETLAFPRDELLKME